MVAEYGWRPALAIFDHTAKESDANVCGCGSGIRGVVCGSGARLSSLTAFLGVETVEVAAWNTRGCPCVWLVHLSVSLVVRRRDVRRWSLAN